MQEEPNSFGVSQMEAYMRKIFRTLDIVILTLALAFTVVGTSSRIAAGTINPSCSINQVLNGQTNPYPGCAKINVGWNS